MTKRSFLISTIISVVVFLAVITNVLMHQEKFFWDFASYYYAGKTAAAGQNAYDVNIVNAFRAQDGRYQGTVPPFVYTPAFLWIFSLISALPFKTALYISLILKLAVIAMLFMIWLKVLKDNNNILMPWIVLIGFGSSLLIDVFTGNISTFEQLFLWSGVLLYIKEKQYTGLFLMILAGAVKTVMLFIPVVLLLLEHRRNIKLIITAGIIITAAAAYNYLTIPLSSFDGGAFNAPAYVLLKGIVIKSAALFKLSGNDDLMTVVSLFYGIYCLMLIMMWLRKTGSMDKTEKIMSVILLYSLISPRLSDYSYIIAAVPVIYFAIKFRYKFIVLYAACLPSLVYGFGCNIFFMYLPFVLMFIVFQFFFSFRVFKKSDRR